ncbi:MAG TPA: hypothetical protein VN782_12260 [Usitatibacter sp.]|nr:hypothetical protein [Usitatibacter sp.]
MNDLEALKRKWRNAEWRRQARAHCRKQLDATEDDKDAEGIAYQIAALDVMDEVIPFARAAESLHGHLLGIGAQAIAKRAGLIMANHFQSVSIEMCPSVCEEFAALAWNAIMDAIAADTNIVAGVF